MVEINFDEESMSPNVKSQYTDCCDDFQGGMTHFYIVQGTKATEVSFRSPYIYKLYSVLPHS